tara:strand:+ start:173 stop:1003 length:831 start_codon:yes stop_codon:yes gene_type:complete
MHTNIGLMQGRLSPLIGNKIQAFPVSNWQREFKMINKTSLNLIEWTLDYKNLSLNPLITTNGKKKIKFLKQKYSIKINSITCDCFMQKPFWKIENNKEIINFLEKIIIASGELKIKLIVIPLVDKGSIQSIKQEKKLLKICKSLKKILKKNKVQIIFESDYHPKKLGIFIKKFDRKYFGINYDTGNSASLNYNMNHEFKYYGNRILNVHIKDRKKFGNTVRLGQGNTNFKQLFTNLKKINYKGNLILQTARSKINKHLEEIQINLQFLKKIKNEIK